MSILYITGLDFTRSIRLFDHLQNGGRALLETTTRRLMKILRFPEMSDEWLDFIAQCRAGGSHPYDIVEGPMADDTIWDFVNGFISGKISRSVFWEYARFKHPTHQISFHTVNALRCLTFERSEHIHDGKTER